MTIWKEINGYTNYEISSDGEVRSKDRYQQNHSKEQFRKGKNKSLRLDPQGYLMTDLYNDGVAKTVRVHRLVAEAFVPNPGNKPTVNHIDGDKTNNSKSNLEWSDFKEQNIHLYKMGLKSNGGISKAIKAMNKAQSKKVKCVNTGEIFESASSAARSIGVSPSRIMKICRENKGSSGRDINGNLLYWEYIK